MLEDIYILDLIIFVVGLEWIEWIYFFGVIVQLGVVIVYGSDWFVMIMNLFYVIQVVVICRGLDEIE